jgi:hypothetical protein
MKHIYFVLFACGLTVQAMGQQVGPAESRLGGAPQLPAEFRVPVLRNHLAVTDMGERPAQPLSGSGIATAEHIQSRELIIQQEIIGQTQYDLQSNAAVDNRMYARDNGSGQTHVAAAWTISLEGSPFSDRGTGYNLNTGETWGEIPYNRIEAIRTGWPSLVETASGREISITHAGIDTPLHMTYRDAGEEMWSEMDIPSGLEVGKLWPRAAVAGPDGNTVHLICISTPEGNGGALLNGQNGALLYYRSLDGGSSWDVQDSVFAQLDSSSFLAFTGDSYGIAAYGNTVAFTAFNDWSDSFTMISEDNGDNWTYHTMVDFPVDLYQIDDGLPEIGDDWNEDGLFQEFFNTDGAGAILVDLDGGVHVTYGAMYYMDDDTTDGGQFSYFPGVNGLEYWNPSFGADSTLSIAYTYDIDGNGALDLTDDIAAYYVGLAGMPSMSVDADNNLYVTYSAVMENFSTGIQNYRHIYLVHSEDGGLTWNTETACDLTPDVDFDGYESVFGALAPLAVNGHLDLVYQRDYEPGLHVRGDEDPIDVNDLVHMRVPIADLGDCVDIVYEGVNVDELIGEEEVWMYPNPATDQVELIIHRSGAHEVQLLNTAGQILRSFATTDMVIRMDVSDLASGLYFVQVAQGNAQRMLRLAIR